LLTAVSDQEKYLIKELKSETIGVYENVEIGPNPAVCASMCSNLYDTKQGYN